MFIACIVLALISTLIVIAVSVVCSSPVDETWDETTSEFEQIQIIRDIMYPGSPPIRTDLIESEDKQ